MARAERSSTPPPPLQKPKPSAPAEASGAGGAGKSGAAHEAILEQEFVPQAVTSFEFLRVACSIVGVYLGALWLLDFSHRFLYGDMPLNHDSKLSYVWDHPEPNFTMSKVITEFWSVLTTIPLAGGMLCYLGFRFRLDPAVMGIYVATFYLVRYIPKLELLGCQVCRAKVAVVSVVLVALAAVNLPDYIGRNGGVWTLFYVQAPPVWVASLAALSLLFLSDRKELMPAYRMVAFGGGFLSLAMFLSYCECSSGTQSVIAGVPTLHMAIHISEQIGIYMYGLSLAFLQHVGVNPRRGVKFSWLFGMVPYFHCEAGSWKVVFPAYP